MHMLRREFETLEQNGITRVGLPRIGDPSVIPLWFGEGDLVTPAFIREAASFGWTSLDLSTLRQSRGPSHPSVR